MRERRHQRLIVAMTLAILATWIIPQDLCRAQTTDSAFDVPQTRLTPIGAPTSPVLPPAGSPSSGFNPAYTGTVSPPVSSFDPYAGAPAGGYVQPYGQPPTLGAPSGVGSPAAYGTPVYGGLANQPPPLLDFGGMFGTSGYSSPPPFVPPPTYSVPQTYSVPPSYSMPPTYSYPANIYPSGTPSSLFPSGFMGDTSSYASELNPYRLIQRGRFRHTYISDGDGADDLVINDTDVALAFAIPSFLFSNQPLYIAPSFSLHVWDGPESSTGADLPGNAYSGFIDFSWQSDPNQMAGAELDVSVGAFTEFDLFNEDSLLVRGKGLGTLRITPTSTLKVGIVYLDRVDVKMLPAFGLFCRPSPYKKVDLFFPQPKFAHYLSTVGTNDLWWYVAGEYGGGSWTINRDTKGEDQVDINDIRITLGLEWGESQRMRAGMRTFFCETGFVGNRKLVYRHNPEDNLSLGNTWMVSLGIGY